MARSIWDGNIQFGLVNIPVALHAAEERNEMSFKLLDRHGLSPIRNKRVNEKTGKEVPWDDVVKGYEYKEGKYVVISDEELAEANVEANQTVEISAFVNADEISPIYFDKPYYLVPVKKAGRSYALLREVLARTNKVGIAKIVIRSRQHLAAVIAEGPVIVVNLLRYAYELREPKRLNLPSGSLKELKLSAREIKLAEQLVKSMLDTWKPAKYRDTYRDDVMALIRKKVKRGKTAEIEKPAERVATRRSAQVIDITDLLKRSVARAGKEERSAHGRASRKRKAG